MIKKKIIITWFLILSAFTIADAKKSKVEHSLEDYEALKAAQETLKADYEAKLQLLADSIGKLNAVIDYQKQAAKEKNEANPEFKLLQDSIALLKKTVETQEKEIAALDMVKLRYANGRLQLPYDREKVKEAIDLFNSIQDRTTKTNYSVIPQLLNQYASAIEPVKALISSLEFQGDKNSLTKFDEDKWRRWKEGALQNIRNNSFYKDSKKQDYRILYLYNIILEAEQRVSNSKGPMDIPTFSDLLIRLNMN